MDFTLTPEWEDLRTQGRNFIGDEVLYLEEDRANYDDHENIALSVLKEKRAAAKAVGLWAPQAPKVEVGLACRLAHGQPFMKRPIDQFLGR